MRDLAGLFLLSSGMIGLLGVLWVLQPLVALFLAGLLLAVGGGTVLYTAPPLPRPVRVIAGYGSTVIGLCVLVGLALHLTPWALVFTALLAVGGFLSSEGA